jgi:hypothetical protein
MRNAKLIMRILLFTSFLSMLFFSCGSIDSSSENKFLGTWKLDSFEYKDLNINKWITDSTKAGYKGFIIYDGKGHMSVQITPGEYDSLNGQLDIESLGCDTLKDIASLYSKNYSYFANYILYDNLITHNIISSSNPDLCGKQLERNYEFIEDTLYLIPVVSDNLRKNRLKWIRVN